MNQSLKLNLQTVGLKLIVAEEIYSKQFISVMATCNFTLSKKTSQIQTNSIKTHSLIGVRRSPFSGSYTFIVCFKTT